jgi:hypothetical protein
MTLEYLAGLIDGEGHIYRPLITNGRGEKRYYPRILFVQTKKNHREELCDQARRDYGGCVSVSGAKKKNPCYRWELTGSKAEVLIRSLLPIFRVKQDQANKVLQELAIYPVF